MSFTALTNMGVASLTVSSAALFKTFNPSSAKLLNPILRSAPSTFYSSSGSKILTNSFLKKPSVCVNFLTCLSIPKSKASLNPDAISTLLNTALVCGNESTTCRNSAHAVKFKTISRAKILLIKGLVLYL